jgi:acyl carrier protein
MGLDIVEMVMEIEERFGIEIEDDALMQIRTVGDMHVFLMSKLQRDAARPMPCLSSRTFYRLRRAMMAELGVARNVIRPKVPVDAILRREDLEHRYRQLELATGLTLPELRYPTWTRVLLFLGSAGLILAAPLLMVTVDLPSAPLFAVSVFLAFTLPVLLIHQRAHLARTLKPAARLLPHKVLPGDCTNVGGLTKAVMARNPATIAGEDCIAEGEVFKILKEIISKFTDVPAEEITAEKGLIDDLKME